MPCFVQLADEKPVEGEYTMQIITLEAAAGEIF